MGKRFRLIQIICFLVLAVFPFTAASQPYVPNEIIVKFASDTSDLRKAEIRESLKAKLISKVPSISVEHWRLPGTIPAEKAIEQLENLPEVVYAEPNYLYKPQAIPDDPAFSLQWNLLNEGQMVNGIAGTPGADISAAAAWDIQTGSPETVVAVIDSGVALDHPDIRNNIWVNPDEIPGNGNDDDENGYIDDVNGWDFVNNDSNPSDYSQDLYGDGHGTHVAGIIAAEGNNGIGISGVMWKAQIMPLQVFDLFELNPQEAAIQSINIIEAVSYAVDNGAKIINCSFGGAGYSSSQFEMFKRAGEQGCLIIAAAGNDRKNNDLEPTYPANYKVKQIISVAATDEYDNLAEYSDLGPLSVDLAAPGGDASISNIYSLTPPPREILFTDDFESGPAKWVLGETAHGWSVVDGRVVFGSADLQKAESYIQTAEPVPAENSKGINIFFDLEYQLAPPDETAGNAGDYLIVEASQDGVTFTPIYSVTGYSGEAEGINLWSHDDAPGAFYLRFLVSGDESVNSGSVIIDDLVITGIEWDFSVESYGYKSGTSMATPVVSGVTGLIWSENPNLEPLDVKAILLGAVDPVEALEGKILTGGRVNAARAMEMTATGIIPTLPRGDEELANNAAAIYVSGDGEKDGGGCFIAALKI